ncbi:MAG: class I SAM-dependent methyltransferase, partial [Verrucomicrobiae bacterium]|nr:class I SAM-dependent methyltransferase [Verrucomicrobiae bacterium]
MRADAQKPPVRLKLSVSPKAETILRGGHPWLFSDSIRSQNREGAAGELAVIYDRKDAFLAIGLYDPDSPIRVRVLHAGKPATLNESWWRERLRRCIEARSAMFAKDPNTTGYRVCNGESEGWPGWVIDRYADTLVLKIYSAAWFPHLEMLLNLLGTELPSSRVVLRLSRNIQSKDPAWRDGTVIRGEPLEGAVVFHENGIAFEAEVLRGQKTGFFLDQRDNRRLVGELSRGRDVLNA